MPAPEPGRRAPVRLPPRAAWTVAAVVGLDGGLVAALALAACGDPRQAAGTLRPDLATAAPAIVVEPSRMRHEGVLVPAGEPLTWPLSAAAAGRLRFAWAAQAPGTATLTVTTAAPMTDRPIFPLQRTFDAGAGLAYEDLAIATDAPAVLRFVADSPAGIVISDLRIVQPSRRNDALIVLLLDTTRRDAIGLYGSRRPTTPQIDRIFAGAWKAERAWAPASWTTPSVAALLTGMAPASQEDAAGASVGIAPDLPTLGHDFARAGWSTAHFNANPALNVENGFHRGFTTFYTPPYEMASMALPGSDMLARLPEWLRAHDGERFLLYLQLIEPHEPYGRPDQPKGVTPFDPDYTGSYRGDESHYRLSASTRRCSPATSSTCGPSTTTTSAIGDLLIGQFWDGLDTALRDRATLVFLSDHGEEFLDHRDGSMARRSSTRSCACRSCSAPARGELPSGAARDAGLARDFLPTIEQHLGMPLRREVDGVDLLEPANWTREALPPIHMLTGGLPGRSWSGRDQNSISSTVSGRAACPTPAPTRWATGWPCTCGASCRRSAGSTSPATRSSARCSRRRCPAWTPIGAPSSCRWRTRGAASMCASSAARRPRAFVTIAAGAAGNRQPSPSPSSPRTPCIVATAGAAHRPARPGAVTRRCGRPAPARFRRPPGADHPHQRLPAVER